MMKDVPKMQMLVVISPLDIPFQRVPTALRIMLAIHIIHNMQTIINLYKI